MYLYPSSAEQNDHVCLVGAETLNVCLTAAAATRAACHPGLSPQLCFTDTEQIYISVQNPKMSLTY